MLELIRVILLGIFGLMGIIAGFLAILVVGYYLFEVYGDFFVPAFLIILLVVLILGIGASLDEWIQKKK